MAPAGTPKPIAQRMHQEVVKALGDAAVREQLMTQGLTPRGTSPDELASALGQQLARYEALFRQAGIRAD
jgi:tripartite-type tricarboxylate transporter receptor subunit TctC